VRVLEKNRGRQQHVVKISRRNFLEIGALSSGLPNGLIAATPLPSEEIDREVDSCCQFCQVRCTTKVQVKGNRVVNIYGNSDNFWTGGSMCPKGQSMVEITYSPHRLFYPLLREGGKWKKISYSQAVTIVASRLLEVKKDFPEDYSHRAALFAPLWESRESELAASMALRIAGFPDICSPGDACIGNTATTLRLLLGSPNSTTTLDEVLNAETLILFGANIAEMYPPYMRWLAMAREKGVKIVFIDPRRTPTSSFSDIHYKPRPGTDGALALGIIHLLLMRKQHDLEYVREHVNGFDELAEAARAYTPEKVEEITWIPVHQVEELAECMAESRRTLVWLGGSISRYTNAMQTTRIIIGLQAITGNLAGPGKGIMNVQGGKPGGEQEFLEAYILNSSYRRYPDAAAVRAAIEKVGFVVYRGFFMDEEAELSDLIIPASMVFESEGSQYGAQRQVVWRNKAVARPGETVEDWRFYSDLGKALNGEAFPDVSSAQDIYNLFRENVESWQGLTLNRLKSSSSGVTWPSFSEDQPDSKGTIFPEDKFATPDQRVDLASKPLGKIEWSEPKGSPKLKGSESKKEFPLIFTQGKVVQHWQHTYTNWSEYMGQLSKGSFVQIHPISAKEYGINDGDEVYIETEIGKLRAVASLTESILPGVIFAPSHPGPSNPVEGNKGASINTIIPSYWDKVSAQFNGFGCRLTKI
jgi:formate dehydrogenase major subunit